MRVLVVSVADVPNDLAFNPPRLPEAAFLIPARGPKERYTSAWVNDAVDMEDRGYDSPRQRTEHRADDHMGKSPTGADVMVPGIASQMLFVQGNATDMRARGYFIAKGDKPTEEELAEAEKLRNAFRRKTVDDARFSYQKHRHSRFISDEAFWAAERMGLEEEWMPLAANPCPNCGRAVKSTAATCVHCGLILDEEKYAAFHFAKAPAAPLSTGLRAAGAVR